MEPGTVRLKYQFSSPSTLEGKERYINPIIQELFFIPDDLEINEEEKIGEIEFDRVYPEKIIMESESVSYVFDEDSEFYSQEGIKISDGHNFHPALVNIWRNLEDQNYSFAYIYSYWLSPKFRNGKLITRAIFDIINEFNHGIDLFVISVKPWTISEDSDFIYPTSGKIHNQLIGQNLLSEELKNQIKKYGFQTIEEFPDLMFFCPKGK